MEFVFKGQAGGKMAGAIVMKLKGPSVNRLTGLSFFICHDKRYCICNRLGGATRTAAGT